MVTKPLDDGRASRIQLDGAMRAVPGYEGTATAPASIYAADQAPILLHSGVLTFSTALTTLSFGMVPFNGTIVSVQESVVTAVTATALSYLIGTTADTNHFVESRTLTTGNTVALNNITTNSEVVNTSIDEGDGIILTCTSILAGGAIDVTLVVVPRLT